MALTPSTMLELGTRAPDFSLPDTVSGRTISLSDFKGSRAVLVMFICNHCPYVVHVRDELVRIGRDYGPGSEKGVGIVAISSNDAEAYPEDSPGKLAEAAGELGFDFPLCYDATQEVARCYRAACTPDFFLFDRKLELAYRGQLDDSRPGNGVPVTGADLRAALDSVLAGKAPARDQRPSMGCNIKWKAGRAPDYA